MFAALKTELENRISDSLNCSKYGMRVVIWTSETCVSLLRRPYKDKTCVRVPQQSGSRASGRKIKVRQYKYLRSLSPS